MPYEEKDLENKLVLKKFDKNKLSIYCVPEELKMRTTFSNEVITYPGNVPGRKHYPEDRSIPLEIYCGRKQPTEPTGALVKIVWQDVIHTTGRTATNMDYIITEVKE